MTRSCIGLCRGRNAARLLPLPYQQAGDTPHFCSVRCAVSVALDYAENGWDQEKAQETLREKIESARSNWRSL